MSPIVFLFRIDKAASQQNFLDIHTREKKKEQKDKVAKKGDISFRLECMGRDGLLTRDSSDIVLEDPFSFR